VLLKTTIRRVPGIRFDMQELVPEETIVQYSNERVRLSMALVHDNPISVDEYLFLTEPVFKILEPHLDWHFVIAKEIELKALNQSPGRS